MKLLELSPAQEELFQRWIQGLPWYGDLTKEIGNPPNLDDPLYDYRRAWKAGITPSLVWEPENKRMAYHWPSKTPAGEWLKDPDKHPTAWMEKYLEQGGSEKALEWLQKKLYNNQKGGNFGTP